MNYPLLSRALVYAIDSIYTAQHTDAIKKENQSAINSRLQLALSQYIRYRMTALGLAVCGTKTERLLSRHSAECAVSSMIIVIITVL